jgi:hypothetical protein
VIKNKKKLVGENIPLPTIDPATGIYISLNILIADRIEYLLKKRNKNSAWLAKKLFKKESEISRWKNTHQNFTLRTLAKLENVFGEPIISVEPSEFKN